MSFIRGDNSAPLLLFPCTKSVLCSFAFSCNISQWGRCINKGSSSLHKLLIWTLAVSKSTGLLLVIISTHRRIGLTEPPSRYKALFVHGVFVLQFPPSCGSSCLTSASLSGPSENFGAKLTFFVFTAPLISSCYVPPTAAPDIADVPRECCSRRNSPSATPSSPLSSFLISLSPTDPQSRQPPHFPLFFFMTTGSSS